MGARQSQPMERGRNPNPGDTELLRQTAGGDKGAFHTLYDRYRLPVARYLHGVNKGRAVEEITQEVFVRVWLRAGRFGGKSTLGTWILAIARRVWLEFHREARRPNGSKGVSSVYFDDLTVELPANDKCLLGCLDCPGLTGPPADSCCAEVLAEVDKAIRAISKDDRAIIVAFLGTDGDLRAIARRLHWDCSADAARMRVTRAIGGLAALVRV